MHFSSLLTLVAAFSLATCNDKKQETATTDESIVNSTQELPPVETEKANTNYKPAFPGQTRINGVKTATPIEGVVLSKKLDRPWGLTVLPNNRFLITQKAGTFVIADSKGNLSEPINGVMAVNDAGQGGLLDVTTDPNFSSNRMIYWTFSLKTAEGNQTAVGKGRLSDDEKKIENATLIFKALPAYKGDMHYGSRIAFDRTGNLIVTTGERSDLVTRPQAQWLNSALGKVLRITIDGKAASGNPTFADKNAFPELYSYGHRNVQGLAIHPETGAIWENEMGPRGGDELNLIQPGKNYGWPTITYGIEYSGEKIGDAITQKAGMEQPVYYWDPVISGGGMTFYSGNAVPEWKNNLFIAGMSSKHIIRLVIENEKVVGEERFLEDENERFRAVKEGLDGALYAITDSGKFYRVGKK